MYKQNGHSEAVKRVILTFPGTADVRKKANVATLPVKGYRVPTSFLVVVRRRAPAFASLTLAPKLQRGLCPPKRRRELYASRIA